MAGPTIDIAFIEQFNDNLYILAQQKGSKLRPFIREKGMNSKAMYFDRLGAVDAVKKTTRHQDTPIMNSPHSRRKVTLEDWIWADLVDSEDEVRMLIDPKSDYALSAAYSIGRAIDKAVIAAMTGNAYSVDADDVATAVALPGAQKVPVNASGLTMAKIRSAKDIFDSAEIPEEDRVWLYSSKQLNVDLLSDNQVTSSDWNTVKALVKGELDTWMGFKWVRTQLLTKDGSNIRYNVAFAKQGVGLMIGKDIKTRMSERDDKNYAMQVHCSSTFGCVRIEDACVVEVACQE